MPQETQIAQLLQYVQNHGMIRARDLGEIDVPRSVLKRLVDRGDLVRRSRGVYTLPNHELTRHTDLAEVCARTPKATVCLISALEFHELTTQVPHSVWIMIDRANRRPKIDHPPIRVIYASGNALTYNVETHEIEGVEVRVTDPAKTVADCFKYRSHVGLEVAIEALRDCLQQRKATPGEIYEAAKIDRVAKTVRPYIEALV
jgi:predicted transcriptional regulator of viral defense system